MKDRRHEGRFLCADVVRVDWIPPKGSPHSSEAVLEDISPQGACVQVDDAIPVGCSASIAAKGARLDGVISYCVFRDYGYFAGIRFADQVKWSSELFEPDHLTNLQALARKARG